MMMKKALTLMQVTMKMDLAPIQTGGQTFEQLVKLIGIGCVKTFVKRNVFKLCAPNCSTGYSKNKTIPVIFADLFGIWATTEFKF